MDKQLQREIRKARKKALEQMDVANDVFIMLNEDSLLKKFFKGVETMHKEERKR